jgi:hypothetical protein
MKKLFTLIAGLMMLSASAANMIVYDGNATSSALPISSNFMDWGPYTHQVIYPEAYLGGLIGENITAVKYFVANEAGSTLNGGKVSLYIGTTYQTVFSVDSWNNTTFIEDGLTKVAEMTMTAGSKEIEFTFDTAWTYDGGNIVIQTVIEEDGSVLGSTATNFIGQTSDVARAATGKFSASPAYFLPKTAFIYDANVTVYTVVGPDAIFGSNWDTTDTNNDMVLGVNGEYSWSKEGVTLYGNFDFKVVGNHSYDVYEWPMGPNNWTATVDEEGIYDILITFDPNAEDADRITCTLTKTGDIDPVEHTYTIAGTENLCGSFWNPADEANNMVKGEDGIYTWSKNNLEMSEGEKVEFKVTQDHAWTYAWPSNNWEYTFEEAGTYNVVITFNADTKEITFTATNAGATYQIGDVNKDGNVRIDDVTALIDALLSGNTDVETEHYSPVCANVNGDESVSISDVTALIDILLAGN